MKANWKIRFIGIVLSMSIAVSLAACGTPQSQSGSTVLQTPSSEQIASQQANDETYLFTDDLGREVQIPTNVQKFVPSAPLSQIILFAIAPEKMSGLASEWHDTARGIIDDNYFELPCFGNLYPAADLNVEELALADPDLIIDIGVPKDSVREDLDTLQRQTDIPSVYISATLETMPETYRKLGKLLGKEEQGEQLASFCEKVYQRTASIMTQVGDNKVNALYVIGQDGLNVLAKDSYHAELLDMLTNNLAQVDNPLSKGTGNEVTMEQISLWNPDFVIFSPDSIYDTVEQTDTWNQMSAIRNGQYVEVPNVPQNWMSMPPSAQRYLGLIWLPSVLYPEYCDYDVKEEIMEFYKLFYHSELSEEQYQQVTENAFLK